MSEYVTVSVSMPEAMLEQAERLASEEQRSVAELLREAYRQYAWRKRWGTLRRRLGHRIRESALSPDGLPKLLEDAEG